VRNPRQSALIPALDGQVAPVDPGLRVGYEVNADEDGNRRKERHRERHAPGTDIGTRRSVQVAASARLEHIEHPFDDDCSYLP